MNRKQLTRATHYMAFNIAATALLQDNGTRTGQPGSHSVCESAAAIWTSRPVDQLQLAGSDPEAGKPRAGRSNSAPERASGMGAEAEEPCQTG